VLPAPAAPSRPSSAPRRGGRPLAALAAVAALVAGCTGPDATDPEPTPTPVTLRAAVTLPEAPATVVPDEDPAAAALAVSAALFAEAPVAVLAAGGAPEHLAPAASVGVALGAPVLLPGDGLADELERLGTTELVALGDAPAADLPEGTRATVVDGADTSELADLGIEVGAAEPVPAAGLTAAVAGLSGPGPVLLAAADDAAADDAAADDGVADDDAQAGEPDAATPAAGDAERPAVLGAAGTTLATPDAPEGAALLVDPAADSAAATVAAATARAAGVPVVAVPGGDPRATSAAVAALTGVTTVLAVGPTFGDAARLGTRVEAAATGVELPGGGQLVFPVRGPGVAGKRYVALYGTPGTPSLGVLGEQDVPATVARAEQTAAQYDPLTDDTVVPMLEIIATVASAGPEADGSYSRPRAVEDLRPLVEAAEAAGQPVLIDLQPGRTDFLTQAQQFAPLLEYPHVGLALDPEWRLKPDQVHLRQIGSVGIDEVNATAAWLAQFTRDRDLPQKMFLLHQFSLRMITERERLDTSHDELAMIIHADGQGSQPAKAGTWATLRQGAPPVHWGWKNFYDEDLPMLDPVQTYQVQPVPDLVTYQ
jgi:hypothetical protein